MEYMPVVIDCDGKIREIAGLAEFIDSRKKPACCFDTGYYELRLCSMTATGTLNCSSIVEGNILNGLPDPEQLRKYNEMCKIESYKIKCIHKPDGTKIYPAS